MHLLTHASQSIRKAFPVDSVFVLITLVCLSALSSGCSDNSDNREQVYDRLMKHAGSFKIIDTHEHQRKAKDLDLKEYNFYSLITHNYYAADLSSAGAPALSDSLIYHHSLDTLWSVYGQYFKYSANTSFFKYYNAGLQQLYDYHSPELTRENVASLSAQITEKYKDYPGWFDNGFRKANFEIMFLDQFWAPYNRIIDTAHFALVFNVRDIVAGISKGANGPITDDAGFYQSASQEGYAISSLDDYLAYTDHLFKENLQHKAICLKSTLAYDRTLAYDDVSYDTAFKLFAKAPGLSAMEKKLLEDFMFHQIIKKAIASNLPIQIHTGYFANRNNINNGEPAKLNNLFLQYPQARFVLFHGGYPWMDESIALGKMFPNVYLDLVWLSQISKKAAIRMFDEMLDAVPYNKILLGAGDCQLIEAAVGALQFDKEVVSEVLANRVIRGDMSEEMAFDIVTHVFRQNAINVFDLDKKLGIK